MRERVTTAREFDPAEISFRDLLTVFFATHDPTTLNSQGNDRGLSYRSAIFYTTPEQKKVALPPQQLLAGRISGPVSPEGHGRSAHARGRWHT